MKFKAQLRDPKRLSAIASTARSFSRKCIVKLHEGRLRFITCANAQEGSQIWTSCKTDAFLSDLRLESRRENEIFCEISDIGQLISALRCADGATSAVIRLAKVGPYEVFRLTMQLRGAHDASHDVAVRVLSETELTNIVAPPLEPNLLQVFLPSLHDVASFVEKVRASGCTSVTFHAAVTSTPQAVALTLAADSFVASYSLHYPSAELGPGSRENPALAESAATVDIRTLSRIMAVREVVPLRIVLHIVHERALVISAFATGDTNVVFYIPAMAH